MTTRHGSMRVVKRGAIRVVVLGAMLSILLAQPANALCVVQPLPRLVKSSDAVWWGTVVAAKAAPPRGPGVWELTVRLDDVLRGKATIGETVRVYTSSCGLVITPSAAEEAAQSFVDGHRLFLVTTDKRGRNVAYSEIVRLNGQMRSTAVEQYNAAVDTRGLSRDGPPPAEVPEPITGHPTDGDGRYMSGTGSAVLLAAAILLGPLIVIAIILRRRT